MYYISVLGSGTLNRQSHQNHIKEKGKPSKEEEFLPLERKSLLDKQLLLEVPEVLMPFCFLLFFPKNTVYCICSISSFSCFFHENSPLVDLN